MVVNSPAARKNPVFTSENRILLFVIGAISLAFLIVATVIYFNYYNTLNNNYDRFTDMITRMISAGGAERIASFNAEAELQDFGQQMLTASDEVSAIAFYDAKGNLIYQKSKVSEKDLQKALHVQFPLRRSGGLTVDPIALGTGHVWLSGKALQEIKGATSNTIIWMFLSAWFISILAVTLNTYILSKHLRTFVRGVKRLSTGDFGYKITEHDLWGELKTLAESFNDMSMRLRAYEDQNLETITFERNKLKAILLSIADGVVVCDNQGKIAIINDAACQMLGFKSSEWAIGTGLGDYMTEEGEKCFEPVMRDFEEQGRRNKDGNLLMTCKIEVPDTAFKVMLSPIQDAEGKTLGFVMIMHDITKENEVDKLKTSFISNVSHELRTPVTTIKSYVDTIYNHGKDLDPQTYTEFIETINVETDRLKKLVNDILDFSRLEEGAYVLERELADITPVINLTVQSVKVLADQKSITLSTAIESNLPKVFINPDSIERVLRNLLSNAIKYTDEGGRIKVRAEVTELGDALEVSVQDTGIGIPDEHLPHIFDRFYRVENKVHTVKGTGLGLHLVKVAIEKHHHGEVFVKSEVGAGSTFGFRIPLGEPGAELPPGIPSEASASH